MKPESSPLGRFCGNDKRKSMNPVAIRIEHLSKTFVSQAAQQKIKALDDLNLEVYQGEILGILGPNGAGKTTFLNILSTLLLPDAGQIEILGIKSIPKNFQQLRQLLNMSSGYPNYPWSLTVEENLKFYGWLYGLRGARLNQRMDKLVEIFGLGEFLKIRFDELSSGTKQKLSLAKALINEPKILFLDEPTIGLDLDMAVRTRESIARIMKESKVTVILTTHYMPEAEELCERIAFIKKGRLLRLASPEELKNAHHTDDLEKVFIQLAQGNIAPVDKLMPRATTVESVQLQTMSTVNLSYPARMEGWLRRCWAFAYRNFLIAARNIFAYVELIFWPIVSLISIGLLGNYLQLEEKALAFILTGAIAGGILQVAQLDVAYSLLYEIWSKSIKHTFLTPITENEYLFGSWLIGIARGLVIFVILSLFAVFFFHFQFPPFPVTLIFLIGIFCSALLLGILVSILLLLCGQKADITAWMFAYLFMLLCGIYYPVKTLPPFFYYLAQWIPITYFLEYFRQSFGFQPELSHGLAKGFILCVFYLTAGLGVLNYALRQARKEGTLIRLSE